MPFRLPSLARAGTLALVLAWPCQTIDDAARAWVQAHRTPALETPMRVLSDKSRAVLIAGGVVALFAGSAGRAFVLESVLALVPVNAVVETLKWTLDRTRPDGDTNRRNSSFPSSHAANAFAMAGVITRRWRRAAIPAWLVALAVAYSRLYMDRHWLSDVAAALLVAAGGVLLAAWLIRRLQRHREPSEAAGPA